MRCLFGHKWDGCKCTKCGTVRDEEHDWDGCKCIKCGKETHQWNNGKCNNCGLTCKHSWGEECCVPGSGVYVADSYESGNSYGHYEEVEYYHVCNICHEQENCKK